MWLPLTPLEFYRRSGRLFGDRIGVVDEGRRASFASFADRVERLAGALRAAGLRPREPVSVLAPNTHHLLEAFYGVPLARGVVHPVSPRRAPLEIAELLNDAGARLLFFHGSLTGLVREILGNLKAVERLVILEGDAHALDFPALEYEALLEGATPHVPDITGVDESAPMALLHTSGGVARPRGVLLSHRALALHALYAANATGLGPTDVSLCSVPFSYMNGGGNPQLNLAVGAMSVLARETTPETLLPLIETERVTVWITAPTVLKRLVRFPDLERFDRSSLRLVLVGGAPVPEALIYEAEERLGARCLEVYGLTEASPFVSMGLPSAPRPLEKRARQGTPGFPILGVEVAVVDEAGGEVPRDGRTVGEILVRGQGVMTAYHRDPEGTQAALRGGWLHTGDLATVDRNGSFRIEGRRKDVILIEGRRVPAREVEAVLISHPDVLECSVIAAPDPERGEVPVGLVVLKSGARIAEQELLEYARVRLRGFKVPRRVEFLSSLPRTDSGEVLKSELRTLFAGA